MRRLLATASALTVFGLANSAHAQLQVTDPPTELNTAANVVQTINQVKNSAIQIQQFYTHLQAIIHGNYYAFGSLVPGLAAMGVVNPVTNLGSELTQMFQGMTLGSGTVGATAAKYLGQQRLYTPTGQDWQANEINADAAAAAAQYAAASTMLDASQNRIVQLPSLGTAIGGTHDIKDSMDAANRVGLEQVVQGEHTNQLLGLISLQMAQNNLHAAQREQAWRCSTDALAQDALTSANAAMSGTVQLASAGSGMTCPTFAGNAGAGLPIASAATGDASTAGVGASGVGDAGTESDDAAASSNSASSSSAGGDTSSASVPGSSDPMSVMTSKSWGNQVAQDANEMGVNPSSVAAVCVVENNCAPGGAHAGSTIVGEFQESTAAYNQYSSQAVAQNPDLVSQVVGQNDATSQGIAAAQYLKDNAISLQNNAGIANPTFLQAYGGYQWGPANGIALATANDNTLLSEAMPNISQQTLANNNAVGETVGQWRAAITAKVGSAVANAPVLNGT